MQRPWSRESKQKGIQRQRPWVGINVECSRKRMEDILRKVYDLRKYEKKSLGKGIGFYHPFHWKLFEGIIKENDLNISFRNKHCSGCTQ